MDIRDTRSLKAFAAGRLENAREEKKIVMIYSGLVIGLAVLVTLISYALELRMEQAGGLSNLGTRSVLSALQTMAPLLQSLAVMCLELGYLAAMLRIARGQYASPRTLKLGFDRFWTLLRCSILQGLLYAAIALGSVYLASMIFVMSPWGRPFMELMMPMMADVSVLNPQLVLDEAMYFDVLSTMVPMLVIMAIVFCVFALPMIYQFRMASYIIIDKPAVGAFAALSLSRRMMRGNCLKLLKLDFSLWWYYLALVGIALIGDADQLLPLLGVELPIPGNVAFVLSYGIYLALTFGAYCFLRNRVEVSYALAYDAIKPEEKKDNGVVLGNIFQM